MDPEQRTAKMADFVAMNAEDRDTVGRIHQWIIMSEQKGVAHRSALHAYPRCANGVGFAYVE